MGAFTAWFVLLGGAALVGGLSGWYLRGTLSWIAGLLLPPALIGLSMVLEYSLTDDVEIMVWAPVALVFAGTPAVLTSCVSMLALRSLSKRRHGF